MPCLRTDIWLRSKEMMNGIDEKTGRPPFILPHSKANGRYHSLIRFSVTEGSR